MIEQEKDVIMLTTRPYRGEQFYNNNDEVTLVLYLGFKQTNKQKNTLSTRSLILVPGKKQKVVFVFDE